MVYQEVPGPSSGLSSNSRYQYLNSPFGDTSFTKVFVGNLTWEIFGDILEAVVNTDKNTGKSKGYNFVTFRELEVARKAYADLAPIIDGRRANCNLASLGRPRPPMPYELHFCTLIYHMFSYSQKIETYDVYYSAASNDNLTNSWCLLKCNSRQFHGVLSPNIHQYTFNPFASC
ncbi:hypothetical protein UlMin_021122 [Ulmus minor]